MRVGLGHDIHRLVTGKELVLGGVPIEFDRGLDGHSDADVLLHAITDALLGAAGLGDIGEWFPNSDTRWKDVNSSVFVAEAVRAVHDRGWKVENLDGTVFAEQPRLAQYKARMQSCIAEMLGVATDAVNIKAKTGETLGPIGCEEAIAADAIVLLSSCCK